MFGYAFSKALTAGIRGGSTQSTSGLDFETVSIALNRAAGRRECVADAEAGAATPTVSRLAASPATASGRGLLLRASWLVAGCFILRFMGFPSSKPVVPGWYPW